MLTEIIIEDLRLKEGGNREDKMALQFRNEKLNLEEESDVKKVLPKFEVGKDKRIKTL